MKIRVINNSIKLLFSKSDVEKVRKEKRLSNTPKNSVTSLFGQMDYGVELVDCVEEGAVFTGSKMNFFLSKKRVLRWIEKGGRVCSQLIPAGQGTDLLLIMEKTDNQSNGIHSNDALRVQMF